MLIWRKRTWGEQNIVSLSLTLFVSVSTSLYLFFFPYIDPSISEQALFMTDCDPVIKTLLGQLTGDWVNQLWNSQTLEYYSVRKRSYFCSMSCCTCYDMDESQRHEAP